jgi:hypothetical protein
MRNLIAVLIAWLMPSSGKHQAATVPTAPARTLPAPRSQRLAEVIEANHLPLVRPYVVAHERQRERQLQRERCTAAVLAAFGIDYPYGPQGRAA